MILAAALLAAGLHAPALQAPDCPAAGDWPLAGFTRGGCPQVYRIQGSAPVERALNLLVVSDAFTETELDAFRCAAGLMVEKLVTMWPFSDYSESINVFRIDLAAAASGVETPADCRGKACPGSDVVWPNRDCQCRALAERSGMPPPLRGRPVLGEGRPACLELDLDVHGCPPTAEECQVMWPEGQGLRRLWRVAACAPAFDVVIVIVNSGAWAGGGTDSLHPPLAVATLTEVGEWIHRSRLLAHELGHALGLLDEYERSAAYSGTARDRPGFHGGRNLVRVVPGELPRDVPWHHLCTPGVAGLETYAAGECFTVCSCDDDCDLPDLGDQPVVGLFEGGFYSDCEFFRPTRSCRMQNAEEEFCPACGFYLEGLFRDLGMRPNPGGPVPSDDPDPACPLEPASPAGDG